MRVDFFSELASHAVIVPSLFKSLHAVHFIQDKYEPLKRKQCTRLFSKIQCKNSYINSHFFFFFDFQYSNFINDYKRKRFFSARRTNRFHRDYVPDL